MLMDTPVHVRKYCMNLMHLRTNKGHCQDESAESQSKSCHREQDREHWTPTGTHYLIYPHPNYELRVENH